MNDKNFDRICAVDEFGRSFLPAGPKEKGKTVGIFYFLWNGAHDTRIHDLNKMLEQDTTTVFYPKPLPEINFYDFHYWGEPLYGYYKAQDEYVVRRHVELLTAAGIDYLLCDTTNAVLYEDSALILLKILKEYADNGWNVPKFACYTNQPANETARRLYDAVYRPHPEFADVWYRPNGKPMIVCRFDEPGENEKRDAEVAAFFDIRRAQWPNEPYYSDGFPWMEWVFPQPRHNDFISVSVAQHQLGRFSACEGNWGRGCDRNGVEHHDDFRLGQNFQRQWDVARESGAHNVFITGWNEWGAMKILHENQIVYVDCFDEEYSRDTEPMKDGYHDAFYLQMIANIRKFRNTPALVSPNKEHTVDISGNEDQWNDAPVYEAFSQTNDVRNFCAIDPHVHYTTEPAENNIRSVRVTHDAENFYFLIETENDIAPYTGKPGWMNLLIGVGDPARHGWEGYTYAVNRRGFAACDKLNCTGNTITYQTIRQEINGRFLKIEIPRKLIGAENAHRIYFKAADSVKHLRDINDYYVTGKVLPLGRLSYSYEF